MRGSCSAMRRVSTRSVKQAAMAAGVGGVRESCSALGRRLAFEAGAASHGTKTATNNKVLDSVSHSLTTPFKVSPSKQ